MKPGSSRMSVDEPYCRSGFDQLLRIHTIFLSGVTSTICGSPLAPSQLLMMVLPFLRRMHSCTVAKLKPLLALNSSFLICHTVSPLGPTSVAVPPPLPLHSVLPLG